VVLVVCVTPPICTSIISNYYVYFIIDIKNFNFIIIEGRFMTTEQAYLYSMSGKDDDRPDRYSSSGNIVFINYTTGNNIFRTYTIKPGELKMSDPTSYDMFGKLPHIKSQAEIDYDKLKLENERLNRRILELRQEKKFKADTERLKSENARLAAQLKELKMESK
jgi:hypothetical protein